MGKNKRIIVRDFDATYQAKLWIESKDNNLKMQKTMKGILRTTYLLCNELTLFYSEIFDGIFFLEWGPEEFARILGFEISEQLPITIFAPTNDINKLKLEAEKLKNSSKFAMCFEDNNNNLNEWLYGKRTNNPDAMLSEEYEEWYAIKSAKWLEAMNKNIVKIQDWNEDVVGVKKYFPFEETVEETIRGLKEELPEEVTTIINRVLNMPIENFNNIENNGQIEVVNEINKKKIEITVAQIEDRRAKVLYFIDEMKVSAVNKHIVFWWWNQQYMKTIANKYSASYIMFHSDLDIEKIRDMSDNDKDDHNGNKSDNKDEIHETLLKIGLIPKKVPNGRIVLQNFNISTDKKCLKINGSLLEEVMELTTSTFMQVKKNTERLFSKNSNIDGARIYDVSLMISDILDTSQTYRDRLRNAAIKFLLVGIPSIIMILYDIEIIENSGTQRNIWIILILLLAIPWSEINEILKLKKSKLSASLTLYED